MGVKPMSKKPKKTGFVLTNDGVRLVDTSGEATGSLDNADFLETCKLLGLKKIDVLTGEALENAVAELRHDTRLLVAIADYSSGLIDYLECLRRSRPGPPYIPEKYTNIQYFGPVHQIGERIRRGEIQVTEEMRATSSPPPRQ